jgi:hypothetical protein
MRLIFTPLCDGKAVRRNTLSNVLQNFAAMETWSVLSISSGTSLHGAPFGAYRGAYRLRQANEGGTMHPASEKFPPVEMLSDEDLLAIVIRAPQNFLLRTPRQKDAQRELSKRTKEEG